MNKDYALSIGMWLLKPFIKLDSWIFSSSKSLILYKVITVQCGSYTKLSGGNKVCWKSLR